MEVVTGTPYVMKANDLDDKRKVEAISEDEIENHKDDNELNKSIDSDNLSTSSSDSSKQTRGTDSNYLVSNNIYKQHMAQSYYPNQDFMMMLQADKMTRTSSNASSASFASSCSSSYSSYSYDNVEHDNHMKALMASKMLKDSVKEDEQLQSNVMIASFADKFSHLIRSRSNSVSESSTASTNSEIIKQLNNNVISSPVSKRPAAASNTPTSTDKSKMEATGNAQCKVCGDEASGYHYGVDSCEGCKGFFRRCITQGMNHQCTNNQQCEMTPFSRNSCQFCRLKKCFAVGMSREASRLGRRPKRAKDDTNELTPVKQIDSKDSLLKISNKFSPNKENTGKSSESEDKAKIKKEKSVDNLAPFKLDSGSPVQKPSVQSSPLAKPLEDATKPKLIMEAVVESDLTANSCVQTDPVENTSPAQIQKESSQQRMNQIEMLTKLISYSDKYTSVERTNELEYIRSCIIDAHLRHSPVTAEKIRKHYLDRPLAKLCVENNPKLDTFVVNLFPMMIKDIVHFCRNIPGFDQIQAFDQRQLLTQGSFEVIIVCGLMLVDAQNKLMLSFDMDYLIEQVNFVRIPLGFVLNDIFELSLQVNSLKLTDHEIALINALLIMNPDRANLQDKDLVEEVQSTILHVLYKHLKHFRSDGTELFLKLLKIIPQVQEISRKNSEPIIDSIQ